jgi:VWFA-related protein
LTCPSIILTAAVFFVPAQQTEKLPFPPERHDISIRLVLVDVIALDKDGATVSSLGAEDFEVFEDGTRVALRSAEFIRPGSSPETAPAAATAGPDDRAFFVVFDSINTIRRMLDRNRTKILDGLQSLVAAGRRVMVLEMAEDGGLLVLQPLTSQASLIAQAVEKAAGSIWVEKAADSLAVPSILLNQSLEASPYGEPPGGKYEKNRRDVYELETRRRFEKTVNGLLAALNVVKSHPGRKSVLFVSGGIPSISFGSVFSGQGGTIQDQTIVLSEVSAAKILDPFRQFRKKGFRSGQEILEDILRFANSHNISFYTLDPDNYLRYALGDMAYDNMPRLAGAGRLQGGGGIFKVDEIEEIRKIELSKLASLARETGGEAFLGGNRFEEFKRTIDRDVASHYELSYTPPRKKADGRYHKITVRTRRAAVELRHRAGYMDYTDAERRTLQFASASYAPELFRDIPVRARIVPFVRGRDRFVLWVMTAVPAGSIVLGSANPEPVRLRYQVTIETSDRSSGYLSDLAIPIVLSPEVQDRLRKADHFGASFRSEDIRLDRDTYRATVALMNENLGQLGTAVCEMPVPRARDDAPVLASLVFGEIGPPEDLRGPRFEIAKEDASFLLPRARFFPMATARFGRSLPVAALVQVLSSRSPVDTPISFVAEGAGGVGVPIAANRAADFYDRKNGVWTAVFTLSFENCPPGDFDCAVRLGMESAPAGRLPVHVR